MSDVIDKPMTNGGLGFLTLCGNNTVSGPLDDHNSVIGVDHIFRLLISL